MARIHGSPQFSVALNAFSDEVGEASPALDPPAECPKPSRFGYLFEELQTSRANRLRPGKRTIAALICLGLSMRDRDPAKPVFNSKIPSIYTYFGQFIVHDLTLDPITKGTPLTKDLNPLSPEIVKSLENRRSGLMDLDSVYGPSLTETGCFAVPRIGDELALAFAFGSSVYGTDLPRGEVPPYDARIGDGRNDENLITSQLHLAFLRAHNKVVQENHASFYEAQSVIKQRYQHLVIHDFLPRIVSREDLDKVQEENVFALLDGEHFMPMEFTAAAFRFGHSMIRGNYDFNASRGLVRLDEIFMPGALGRYINILDDWVIDWSNFLDGGTNTARTFHPKLVEPLSELIDAAKNSNFSLAARDLLRGYLLGLPTGQAVAKAMKLKPLTADQVEATAVDELQRQLLRLNGFTTKTPLWFYLFAESVHFHDGALLGPVCGQIVASVLTELARRSGFDDNAPWDPILGEKNEFDLRQLILHSLPLGQ